MALPNWFKAVAGVTTGGAWLWNQFADAFSGKNDSDLQLYAQLTPPGAPTVAVGSAGVLTGAYQYAIGFGTGYYSNDNQSGAPQLKGNTGGGAVSNTVNPSAQQNNLSAIAIGPTGVVVRYLYRTKANGSTFYYLTTIQDNTTTTWTDNTPDSSLGAQMPTTNTTGGKFYGDGSQLTGITSTQVGAAPAANGVPYATDTSLTANTVTASISPAPSSYTDGLAVCIKIANTSTGASTLALNGLTAVPIKNADGSAIGSGDLNAGVPVTLRYVGGSFFVSGGSGLANTGNATTANVLAPYTFTSATGKKQTGTIPTVAGGNTITPNNSQQTAVTANSYVQNAIVVAGVTFDASKLLIGTTVAGTPGTMPNNGTLNYGPSTSAQSIPAGYTPGGTISAVGGSATASDIRTGKTASSANGINLAGTLAQVTGGNTIMPTTSNQTAIAANTIANAAIQVAGDANLQSANIANGVDIFNVVGSFVGWETLTQTQGPSTNSITFTGLPFAPSFFVITANTNPALFAYANISGTIGGVGYGSGIYSASLSVNGTSATLTSSGVSWPNATYRLFVLK